MLKSYSSHMIETSTSCNVAATNRNGNTCFACRIATVTKICYANCNTSTEVSQHFLSNAVADKLRDIRLCIVYKY